MEKGKIEYGQYYASTDTDEIDLTDIDEIEESACASSSIKHIKGIVRNAGNFAFSVCEGLEGKIEVGGEKVGRAAFERCPLIEEVVLRDDVEHIDGWSFDECSSLTDLTLPPKLKTIGEEAFHKTGIKVLNIEEVDSIESCAFSECSELETVNIQRINQSIKSNVFSKCHNLRKLTYNGATLMSLAENQKFKGISAENDRFFIEYEETISNSKGETSTISHKLPIELDIPFVYGHEELKREPLKIDGMLSHSTKRVPAGILRECKTITGVSLDSVEEIGNNAFDKCSNLKKVDLSQNLRKLGESAFQDSGIEAIDLSKTRYNSY